jgi:O-antigen/teichoic acid export membrane protein/SAM-dependent methyltransferase
VTDQGLYALSNALLNVLLARWLVPAEYGAFAVAYSALLLIGAFHAALFIEPMLVFGSVRYAGRLAGYLRVLVCGNQVLTIAGSLLLIVTGAGVWLFGSRPLAHALFGLAAAVPFTLSMWLAKRAAYVRQQTRLAAAQSLIYLLLLVPGLFVLKSLQLVSVFSATVVMGFAAAVAGVGLMQRIRAAIPDGEEPPVRRAVLTAHWTYGRWALLTGVLVWVPLNLYFVVLSTSISLEASATLKAITNLVLPLLQANAALSALLLPLLATRKGDRAEFRRIMRHALALFAAVAVLYALIIGALGGPLVHLLYGGKYHTTAGVLWLLALIPVLDGVTTVFASALRSLEQPKQVFRAELFAAACVLSVGVAATGAWGVAGAIGAMVLAGLLASMLLAISVRKHLAYPALVLNPKARTNMQNDERQNYCDLCEEEGALYGREKGYDLLSCRRCGLFWTNPLKHDSQEATAEITYPGEEVYLSNSISQKKRFRRQLKTFLRKSGGKDVKSLRVLEVGSGLGFFLDACEELGIPAEGCDIVERAVRFANRERERVRLGTLDDYYPDESFDAIFAFNLIEHLPHPKDLLTQAHRILKPGGTLVLETPIQESLFHRLARLGHALSQGRLNFFGMRPGGHIYKFSKRTFREENGFTKVYQRNIESPFSELWGNSSVLNLDHKFLYRWSLPLAWTLAKVTKQGNRLFLLLRKSLGPQNVAFDTATGLTQR